jgi:hypothetical protein
MADEKKEKEPTLIEDITEREKQFIAGENELAQKHIQFLEKQLELLKEQYMTIEKQYIALKELAPRQTTFLKGIITELQKQAKETAEKASKCTCGAILDMTDPGVKRPSNV